MNSEAIDWDDLYKSAQEIAAKAYAPYSKYFVGAAGITQDGKKVRGCNVENASYGLTLCAECGLVSDLFAQGGGKLIAVAVTDPDGKKLIPCGRCRQVLSEFGEGKLLVNETPITEILPGAFGPADLEK